MKTSKEATNLEIAELLRDVAAAYQLRNEANNKFKIIAYERAADAVEHASSELKDLWDEGKLEDVAGVGESIARHLDELFKTGRVKHFDSLMKSYSPKMFRLMKLPGIGPKTALRLIAQGNQSEIKEKLKEVDKLENKNKRHLLPYAMQIAAEVIEWMKSCREVVKVDPLGSLRRKASTVGDIDIAVASNDAIKSINHFVNYPKAKKVLEKGEATASILLPGEVQVDLMVQKPESYGSLLQHLTGSKHHNIALREYALKKGMSLSEYGIRKTLNPKSQILKFKTEEEFYKYLGLEWIPPELREDTGEIEAFAEGRSRTIPKLVELGEIKADLQIHSSFDIETSHDLGLSSMEEIINKVKSLGYKYLAFTEHNPSRSKHNDKQIIDLLKQKMHYVEKINYSLVKTVKHGVKRVFNSLEIDILPDGSCPIPQEGFEYLDFAMVSIHSGFALDREKMTERVLKALNWHPKVKIFAHPTARKLNEREGIELNWPEIFAYCKDNNKWLEINADPMRLDLPDFLVKEAIEAGVKLTLGTDAHHKDHLDNMKYGVSVARRGWAEKDDIINTRTLGEFERLLAKGGEKQ